MNHWSMCAALCAAFFMLAGCAGGPPAGVTDGSPVYRGLALDVACGAYRAVRATLAEDYGETPVYRIVERREFLVEVYANRARGTASVVTVLPDGRACLLFAGSGGAVRKINRAGLDMINGHSFRSNE